MSDLAFVETVGSGATLEMNTDVDKIDSNMCYFKRISKNLLQVDYRYQRNAVPRKVKTIKKSFSWISFGALSVAKRENGDFYIVDGQHRWQATLQLDHIESVPCIVFDTEDAKLEAVEFIRSNKHRTAIRTRERFNALLFSGDLVALKLKEKLDQHGLVIANNTQNAQNFQCVGWAMTEAQKNFNDFSFVIDVAMESQNEPVPLTKTYLAGLLYIHQNIEDGLHNTKLRKRICQIGIRTLTEATRLYDKFGQKSGSQHWALGLLEAINKKLHSKFTFMNK